MRDLWWHRETSELKGFLSDDLVIRKRELCVYFIESIDCGEGHVFKFALIVFAASKTSSWVMA